MDDTAVKLRDLFQIYTKCSPADAWDAENQICSSDQARKAFMLACGASSIAAVYGGYMFKTASEVTVFTGGSAAPAGVPTAAAGLLLGGVGLLGIKRFCIDFARGGIDAVTAKQGTYRTLGGGGF